MADGRQRLRWRRGRPTVRRRPALPARTAAALRHGLGHAVRPAAHHQSRGTQCGALGLPRDAREPAAGAGHHGTQRDALHRDGRQVDRVYARTSGRAQLGAAALCHWH